MPYHNACIDEGIITTCLAQFFFTKHTIAHRTVTYIFWYENMAAYRIILVDDKVIRISKISICKNEFPSKCMVSCLLKRSLKLAIVLGRSFLILTVLLDGGLLCFCCDGGTTHECKSASAKASSSWAASVINCWPTYSEPRPKQETKTVQSTIR